MDRRAFLGSLAALPLALSSPKPVEPAVFDYRVTHFSAGGGPWGFIENSDLPMVFGEIPEDQLPPKPYYRIPDNENGGIDWMNYTLVV